MPFICEFRDIFCRQRCILEIVLENKRILTGISECVRVKEHSFAGYYIRNYRVPSPDDLSMIVSSKEKS